MQLVRAFLRHNRVLAMLVVMAALCMKIVVPTGYMIGSESRTFTVRICEDALGGHAVKQVVVPMKPGASGQHKAKGANGDCAFASHGMAALAGMDPIQLALALVFILALGFIAATAPPARPLARLRPPLRGPPAHC